MHPQGGASPITLISKDPHQRAPLIWNLGQLHPRILLFIGVSRGHYTPKSHVKSILFNLPILPSIRSSTSTTCVHRLPSFHQDGLLYFCEERAKCFLQLLFTILPIQSDGVHADSRRQSCSPTGPLYVQFARSISFTSASRVGR